MTTLFCNVCSGAGFITTVEPIPCADCNATGGIEGKTCSACNGKGQQYVEMHRVCQQCKGSGLRQ